LDKPQPPGDFRRPIHIAVPVWGTAYVQTFLNYCLPAQLSPGNVPVLAGEARNRYTIYTTRSDFERIERSTVLAALRRSVRVAVEFIDDAATQVEGKYQLKSSCYRAALKDAAQHRAALIALNADIVLADGFMRTASGLLARGKRIIEVPAPRGLRDQIGHALVSDYRSADGIAVHIDAPDLARLWTRHKHPQLAMHHVEGAHGAPFHPSHLYWPVGDEGVIIRGFHLYPIVVDPLDATIGFTSTIDDDLVGNLALSENQRYLAQNSGAMFCCELSAPDHYVGTVATRGDLARYIDFYLTYARHNIRNLEKEIVICAVRQPGPEWATRRQESASFIRRIVRSYRAELRRRRLNEIRREMVSLLRRMIPGPVKAAARAVRGRIKPS
jgi:hypothetical protein